MHTAIISLRSEHYFSEEHLRDHVMGHIRLGTIPKTQKWQDVIASLTGGRDETIPSVLDLDDIALIADKSLEAVQMGLEKAIDDPGLRYTFYILTQVVLTS